MPSGKLAFKETDVARALRATLRADGQFHVRIERGTGDILILPGPGVPAQGAASPPTTADDDLDRELAEWEAKQRA